MEVERQSSTWNGYVDWRRRPAVQGRHGGMVAASFVLVVEVLENLAFLANASNLVRYLSEYMHFSPSQSANSVTNFMGTSFFLALLGGFLSDAFFTTFVIYIASALIQFLGLVLLTIQARSKSLQPPYCDKTMPNVQCEEVHGGKAALLFTGLYIIALGVGGIKGSLAPHGAEQLDEDTPKGRKQRSTFFNYFVFCLSCGALIAVTFVVWIEENKGWEWGLGISTVSIFLSIPVFLCGSAFYRNKIPTGSPLTTIAKVLIASCFSRSPRNVIANKNISPFTSPQDRSSVDVEPIESPSENLKFLNRAIQDEPASNVLNCSVQQVEDVKIVLSILPIFGCTIMLNCCLAQLSTYSVEQAASMDRTLGSMKVPAASLPVFPVVFIMILAPIYDHFIIPFARRVTKSEMGISHLQRIGVGLILSIVAMAIAALVEIKRRNVATKPDLIDSKDPLPLTFFWIALQYLFLGSADLFTLAGLMEFFFTEAPSSMRSLATSLSWASLAMGYYLSSVIVSIVNGVTGHSENRVWLSGHNLNRYRLDLFYWLLCGLSSLNFFHYLFWAMRYKYKGSTRAISHNQSSLGIANM